MHFPHILRAKAEHCEAIQYITPSATKEEGGEQKLREDSYDCP